MKKKVQKKSQTQKTIDALARINQRLDKIAADVSDIGKRTDTIADKLRPLVFDLRMGGWHIPSGHTETLDDEGDKA